MLRRKKLSIDKEKMYEVYNRWPEIAEKSFNQSLKKISLGKPNHIIFAGMGGSGAICDVFSSILSKTKIHVDVVKGYHLPQNINSKTIVIIISISGNTEETLNILKTAHRKKCKIIAFSSGGKIKKFCNKNSIEFEEILFEHSPRASFVICLFTMLNKLKTILPIKKSEVFEAIEDLKKTQKRIWTNDMSKNNPAIELAKWIKEVPIIYFPAGLYAPAIRFKNSLQENSKKHAIAEDIFEACHNGIVSWEIKSKMKPILIIGKNDHYKTKEKWNIVKKFFKMKKIDYREVHSTNGQILSKIVNLIYFLDFVTIYLSIESNIDPSPVRAIDFIKQKSMR